MTSQLNRDGGNVVAGLLRDLVRERTGIAVQQDALDVLMEKLEPMIVERGFASPLDYYYLLKYDADADAEWRRVIDAVSVRETYFCREYDQVRALVDVVIPEYFADGNTGPFRIWSAACASGEEPLTIAMALDRAGLFRHCIEIFASDASEAALDTARRGVYRERSFRGMTPAQRERYFTPNDRSWQIDREIHSRVVWFNANLTRPAEIALLSRANVIFCRNVFIYFSDETIRNIVGVFAEKVKSPGYLFVGAAESLLRLSNDFILKEIAGAFVYQRATGEGARWRE